MRRAIVKIYWKQILMIVAAVILSGVMMLILQLRHDLDYVDRLLFSAASDLHLLLGDDYNNSNIDENSHTMPEHLNRGELLDQVAKDKSVAYLYTLVERNGEVHYTAINISNDDHRDGMVTAYWESFTEAEDNSLIETLRVFETKEVTYIYSRDEYGPYRSVYIPMTSEDGNTYIAGADIFIDRFLMESVIKIFQTIVVLGLIIVSLVPLIMKIFKVSIRHTEEVNMMKLDELTKSYSRRYLKDVERLLDEKHFEYVVSYMDLDDFKKINDTYGHEEGDKALVTFANCIDRALDNDGFLIRLGGDEFVVIIHDGTVVDIQSTMKRTQSFIDQLPEGGFDFEIAFSYGIARSEEGRRFEEILHIADKRMYEQKKKRKEKKK